LLAVATVETVIMQSGGTATLKVESAATVTGASCTK
jgi:hypothetical protein